MTNFQVVKKGLITREAVLFGAPLVLGLMIAAAGAALCLWPAWQDLNRDQQALKILHEQRDRLPLLRRQLAKLRESQQLQENRRIQIIDLIAGSGNISTFMTQLAVEARATGVQLDGYEPVVEVQPAVETTKKNSDNKNSEADKNAPPPPPRDPILAAAPGLEKVSLLITARGNGPALQQFLRRLESLSLLVVQKDLQFGTDTQAQQTASAPSGAAKPPVLMRLSLSLYRSALPAAKATAAALSPPDVPQKQRANP